MIYTVVWDPEAEADLARFWMSSQHSNAVRQASDAIDLELKQDAHLKGKPVRHRRVLIIMPLAVTFSISLDDRMVRVHYVSLATN